MTIFILVSILLVTALAIALLMGVSPASQKVKPCLWAFLLRAKKSKSGQCMSELRLCS